MYELQLVDPSKEEYMKGPQGVQLLAPAVAEKVPAGQRLQEAAPGKEYVPAAQGRHVAMEDAPVTEEAVPAGQAVALTEPKGQNAPMGQMSAELPLQK